MLTLGHTLEGMMQQDRYLGQIRLICKVTTKPLDPFLDNIKITVSIYIDNFDECKFDKIPWHS